MLENISNLRVGFLEFLNGVCGDSDSVILIEFFDEDFVLFSNLDQRFVDECDLIGRNID